MRAFNLLHDARGGVGNFIVLHIFADYGVENFVPAVSLHSRFVSHSRTLISATSDLINCYLMTNFDAKCRKLVDNSVERWAPTVTRSGN